MLKKTYLLAITITLSIILQAYLSNKYFQIHYGEGSSESAICSINETFNCEAVTASSYSQFLNIPLSVWGLGLNLVLFILLVSFLLSDNFKKEWFSALQLLVIISALSSIVMGLISISFLSVYCLFCILLYLLSFAQAFLVFSISETSLKDNMLSLLNFNKVPYTVYFVILLFPLTSVFVAAKMKRDFGGDRFEKQIHSLIESWQTETETTTFANTPATLVRPAKNENTKFEIAEFADFLCGHCQRASRSFKNFLATHDASYRFYVFPLDQTCRTMENTQTGPSCYLAKTVYCSEKQSKGWKAHDWIFERQRELLAPIDVVKNKMKSLIKDLGLDENNLLSCIEDEKTHQAIVNQSKFAQNLNITGTPTVFVNGKKLKGGQVIDVLRRVYDISIDK